MLDKVTDVSTIIGVMFAIFVYFVWERNYKIQKAHEYSLDMIKKLNTLQVSIQAVRGPKFYNENVKLELEKSWIPYISDKIISDSLAIRLDFSLAQYILLFDKTILSKYVDLILNPIISDFSIAITDYNRSRSNVEVKNTKLWQLIFPAEIVSSCNIKRSPLGTNEEIVDDKFNKQVESNFIDIRMMLQKNLVVNKKPLLCRRWRKRLVKTDLSLISQSTND